MTQTDIAEALSRYVPRFATLATGRHLTTPTPTQSGTLWARRDPDGPK